MMSVLLGHKPATPNLLIVVPQKSSNERRTKRLLSNLCGLSFPQLETIELSFLVDESSELILNNLIGMATECGYEQINILPDPFIDEGSNVAGTIEVCIEERSEERSNKLSGCERSHEERIDEY